MDAMEILNWAGRPRLWTRAVIISFCALLINLAPVQQAWSQSTTTLNTKPTILVLGDSISAEYGLPRDTGWVKLLEARLSNERFDYSVMNASISGETTSGGRTRLPDLLKQYKPAIVIIELGGNDGLRGLSLAATEENFAHMIEAAQAIQARVLLIGMQLPPNYGKGYTQQFAGLYPKLAKRYQTALLPFFFEGFGDKLEAFQTDHIHPALATQGLLVANVWPKLKPLLKPQRKS